MATVIPARRHRAESFCIHEDAPSTADTEMNESALQEDDEAEQEDDLVEEADGHESEYSESSEEEAPESSHHIQQDMERLQNTFAGFRQKYRLIKRIGEGWHASHLHTPAGSPLVTVGF